MTGAVRHWGTGPDPALLLHCSLAHSGAWEGVARRLSDRLTMTAPDLVGHGRAPDWDPAQDFHDQTTGAVRPLLPDIPCHLIGHSFGATVALRLAEESPEHILSLTLIEPVLFAAARNSAGQRAHAAALRDMAPALQAGRRDEAARIFLSVWGGGTPFDAMPPQQRHYMADRIHLIPASHAALHEDSAGLLPRLGQVRCPVLLIEGAASPPVIGAIQTALADGLDRATRVAIPGAGHMVPITHPAAVADAIRAFLDAPPPSLPSENIPG